MKTSTRTAAKAARVVSEPHEDRDYEALLERLHSAAMTNQPLFTTDASGLWDAFMNGLPPHRRQHYNCRTCRHFIEKFGGLVTIDSNGVTTSLFWRMLNPFFGPSCDAVGLIVEKARVTGVFYSDGAALGNPSNVDRKKNPPRGAWFHMHSTTHPTVRSLLGAGQMAAEKGQDFQTLSRGLSEFPVKTVRQAHTALTSGGLYRSEKCIGTAKWLLGLQEARAATKNSRLRENITWLAVATAPPGFCHVRSTMIGTLLEDIAAGTPFSEVKRRFDEKMHPLQYQRPTAFPTDGQLAAAEKTVEALGVAGAFKRRFATLADIAPRAVWLPSGDAVEEAGGVFGFLRKSKPDQMDVTGETMTWEKFKRTVLPEAEKIECNVPYRGNFFAFVTAVDPDAPPILQWDRSEDRNPVSWYVYNAGSYASQWRITARWHNVPAITEQPSGWTDRNEHQGNGVYVVLEGAQDTSGKELGLFPEILRSEFHGIRSAIEAYSKHKQLETSGDPACGLCLQKGKDGNNEILLRVTTRGARVTYKIDRWD